MLNKYATLALLISVLGAPPAWAQKMNYLDHTIDMTELIPPPPPTDSAAWKEDLDEVLGMQANRTEAGCILRKGASGRACDPDRHQNVRQRPVRQRPASRSCDRQIFT